MLDAAIDAGRAAVDLAGAQVGELQHLVGRAGLVHGADQALDGLHGTGDHRGGVLDAGFHGCLLSHLVGVGRHILVTNEQPGM